MAENEDLFSRWSQRKRAVAEEEVSTSLKTEQAAEPAEIEPATEEEEAALLERLSLPVPESLGEGDDFSGFMKAGVPGFLRKRALRVLWRSNPVLANLDGLNDYDDDFNSPELTQKVLATAYQVGRGIVRQVIDDPEDTKPPVEEPEVLAFEEQEELPVASTESPDDGEVAFDEDDGPAPRPRRMRFVT